MPTIRQRSLVVAPCVPDAGYILKIDAAPAEVIKAVQERLRALVNLADL
jgi:hypothetical protein